jgi:hypothetical protein
MAVREVPLWETSAAASHLELMAVTYIWTVSSQLKFKMTPVTVIDNVFYRQFQEWSLFYWTGDKNGLFDHDTRLLMLKKDINPYPMITFTEENRDW